MPILKLQAQLGLDKTGFDAGLSSASKSASAFGSKLSAMLAGTFTAAAVTQFARTTIQSLSEINDTAKSLGIGTEALQEFAFAAKQNGADLGGVAIAFRALAKARAEALADPSSKASQAFGALGISPEALKAQTLEETFRKIASVVQSTDFGTSEITLMTELLGRAGNELVPMFRAGLEESSVEARRLGVIIDEDVVSKVDEIGDSIDAIVASLRNPMAEALGFISDMVRNIVDTLDLWFGSLGAFIGAIQGGSGLKGALTAIDEHVQGIVDRRNAPIEKPIVDRERGIFEFEKPGVASTRSARNIASAGSSQIPSDQFQRIGAFTGASAQAAQTDLARRQLSTLERLRDDLIRRGIIVKTE